MYELRRILVPTDFSHHADAALEHAIALAHRSEAEITLLHVDEFPVTPLGASREPPGEVRTVEHATYKFVEEQFMQRRASVKERGKTVRTLLLQGRAYKVIVEESERQEYDLIVMATRGHTHLSSHLIGSTVERVVRLSRQPVLSIMEPPRREERPASVLCPTDLSPAGNVALPYALSIARQNNATLFLQYISELDKPESDEEIRRRLPDLTDFHPRAREVHVEHVFDRDVEPSNAIIRFADDRDVGMIVMSTHGRKGLRRVYIGNNTAEVVRKSVRPVLTVTHPLHKKVFTAPVTEKKSVTLSAHTSR